jgi:hypothetical protein
MPLLTQPHRTRQGKSREFHRKADAIAEKAVLDGIYVVRTSLPAELLDDAATVTAYKSLSGVERALRAIKTTDIEIRPTFHWASPRVKAHVMLCMLAYYVEHHMRARLARRKETTGCLADPATYCCMQATTALDGISPSGAVLRTPAQSWITVIGSCWVM